MDFFTNLVRHYRSRPDSEHEQGFLRVAISVCFLVYFGITVLWGDPSFRGDTLKGFIIATAGLLHGTFTLVATARNLKPSPFRRVLGMFLDFGMACLGMTLSPELFAPAYTLFLWVSIGNGIRYGQKYLVIAVAMTVVAFSIVIALTPFWQKIPTVAGTLLIALVVIPFYLSRLMSETTKARDREKKANEAKSRFLAHISHEFRTPLNGISGMSQLMASCQLDPEPREYLAHIEHSSTWMRKMVKDVLDFSTIEAGKVKIETEVFKLEDIIRHVAFTLMPAAVEKGIILNYSIDPVIPPDLVGSPGHLQQVLLNLVGNSLKFTDEGSIDIQAIRIRRAGQLVWVEFNVKDTGSGMSAEVMKRVYRPFEHSVDGRHITKSGTGLGTSIAKGLVEANGGSIAFNSTEGVGTTFSFILPFQSAEAISQVSNESNTDLNPLISLPRRTPSPSNVSQIDNPFAKHQAKLGSKLKILVADDQETNRILMDRVLTKAGHQVTCVECAEPAMDLLADSDFDLAIIDYHMPDTSGYDVMMHLRVMEAGRPYRTPVIIATADVTDEAQEKIRSGGADGFLPKPVDITFLLDMIRELASSPARQNRPPRPPRPQAPSTPVSEATIYLAKLRTVIGNEGRFQEFVRIGLGDAKTCLKTIEDFGNRDDWHGMQDQLHALKGVASHMGLTGLAAASERMRLTGKAQWRRNLQGIREIYERGAEEIESMVIAQDTGKTSRIA